MKTRILGIKPEKLVIDVYDVEVIKLNDFILDRKLNHINVLKIDTEGHELKCLEGLFSGQGVSIDIIQLENHRDDMHFNEISEDEITNILYQNQFKLNKKIKHGFGEFDELIFKTNKSNK